MTLYVHHGPRLGPLADDWARRISAPLDDPFAAEVVAVPTAGVRDWLRRRLADRLGIAANIELPFPGRFIASALGQPADADDPWALDRLVWSVLAVLESGAVEVPGWRHATEGSSSRRYSVARRIADLFDRYATNRPELLRQWQLGARGDGTVRPGVAATAAGIDGDELLVGALDPSFEWQFHLWREVRTLIGTPSPAEQLPDLVAALRDGRHDPALPPRVGWFGTSNVPPSRLAVVHALAARRDVHLYVVHPSPAGWATVTAQLPGRPIARRRDVAVPAAGHPLLRSWGRATAELASLVQGLAAHDPKGVEIVGAAASEPPPTTLLQQVQADLLADRVPIPRTFSATDRSIRVHACHGATRQLDVLRDALGHLFAADPTLHPSDVLIVCPDIDRFGPMAEAVFARGAFPVPLAVTDLSLGSENPVAAALVEVVRVASGRCSTTDVLALAGLEPVRRRLGLTVDDLDTIAAWASQLGTSWGLDADHRTAWLGDALADGAWESAVRSLLLGAAMPSEVPRIGPGEVVPFDDMNADGLVTAGRLAELIARLGAVRERLAASRPMSAWCDVLDEALALFCSTSADDAWRVTAVAAAIDDLRAAATAAPTALLDASDLRSALEHLVTERRGRLRLRTGAVTLTGLVPVRNLPARVVAVLGFDEESLRPPAVDGDDLLTLRPCLGEPDRRAERRQLVLDSLLAAGDHFVVVCDGNDITTNRPVRFPVQLTELLEVIDATIGVAASTVDAESPVVERHPLRSYDEANFGGRGDLPFSFDPAMLAGAQRRREADDGPTVDGNDLVGWWSLGAEPASAAGPRSVTLAQLNDACARPVRTLLRDGLDIRLPDELAAVDTLIPIGMSKLDASAAGRRLIARLSTTARGHADDVTWAPAQDAVVAEWKRAESLTGRLPPRALSHRALADVADEVNDLIELVASLAGLHPRAFLGATDAVELDVDVLRRNGGGVRLVDRVERVLNDGSAGSVVCRLSYTRLKPRLEIAAALDLAAVVAVEGDTDWSLISVARGDKAGSKPIVQRWTPRGHRSVDTAHRLLTVAGELFDEAVRRAIPLFEKTSKGLHKNRVFDEFALGPSDFGGTDLDDNETAFVWAGVPVVDLLALEPDPQHYADLLWGAIGGFANCEELKVAGKAKS